MDTIFVILPQKKKSYSGVATCPKIKPDLVDAGINKVLDNEGRMLFLDFKDFIIFNI
jgi:exodeoxyribonuclease-3